MYAHIKKVMTYSKSGIKSPFLSACLKCYFTSTLHLYIKYQL